jgi:hypothetical protein
MKKILLSVLVFSTVIFFSCKSGGSDPKAVLTEFFDALSKKDIAAARKLATEDSKSMLDMMEMGMKMDANSKETDKYDKTKMEFGEPKIEGDKATIAVKEKGSGETLNFTLKKEKGNWKVAFDKASMMTMGMDKMKEKGIDANETIKNAMDSVNMDEVRKGVDEGLKVIDSMKKNP